MSARNPQPSRKVLTGASVIDVVLSGSLLLIYFGVLSVGISGWNISRQVLGSTAAIWFVGALAILVYPLIKTDTAE
jgi:hypothetical protein